MKAVERIIYDGFEVRSDLFYSVAKLAKGFKIKTATVRQMIKRQDFRAQRFGKRLLIAGKSVIEYSKKDNKNQG